MFFDTLLLPCNPTKNSDDPGRNRKTKGLIDTTQPFG